LLALARSAFLLLAQLGGLDVRQLLVALALFLAQLQFLRIRPDATDRGAGAGAATGAGGGVSARHLGAVAAAASSDGFALHEHALLAHFHLDGARFAHRIRLLDLAGLLARQRDLVLRLGRAVRLAQVLQEARLSCSVSEVLGNALFNAGGAQLLEQTKAEPSVRSQTGRRW
jgi:hypothetical protein